MKLEPKCLTCDMPREIKESNTGITDHTGCCGICLLAQGKEEIGKQIKIYIQEEK